MRQTHPNVIVFCRSSFTIDGKNYTDLYYFDPKRFSQSPLEKGFIVGKTRVTSDIPPIVAYPSRYKLVLQKKGTKPPTIIDASYIGSAQFPVPESGGLLLLGYKLWSMSPDQLKKSGIDSNKPVTKVKCWGIDVLDKVNTDTHQGFILESFSISDTDLSQFHDIPAFYEIIFEEKRIGKDKLDFSYLGVSYVEPFKLEAS